MTRVGIKLALGVLILLVVGVFGGKRQIIVGAPSMGEQLQGLDVERMAVNEDGGVLNFEMKSRDNVGLMATNMVDEAAAEDFIERALGKKISGGAELAAEKNDTADVFLKKKGFLIDAKHYYYQQEIGGVPVFGGELRVHLRDSNEIYKAVGNVVTTDDVSGGQWGDEKLRGVAMARARIDSKGITDLIVSSDEEWIINKKLLGISKDETNYRTLAVTVTDKGGFGFARKYYVGRMDGKILWVEEMLKMALNRNILECENTSNCYYRRREGQQATGMGEVDRMYDVLGEIYGVHKNIFGRDSYDGLGAMLKGYVNYQKMFPSQCPNALWSEANLAIVTCEGMTTKDVVGHEFGHAINGRTARFSYHMQSGAIDEGISDVYAYMVDPNWTLGEGSTMGVVRRLDDPSKSPGQVPQADRLFSPNYLCLDDTETKDWGGVHYNNGLVTKAFYLIANGGSFNGCNIAGIGDEKAELIFYRAATTYLTTLSNYRSLYEALNQACTDLYQGHSETCKQVDNALKSVEMDQQPAGEQKGAKCLGITAKIPQCQGSNPTATPTPAVTCKVCPDLTPKKMSGNANCDAAVDFVDFAIWRSEYFDKGDKGIIESDDWGANFSCEENNDKKVDMTDFVKWLNVCQGVGGKCRL